MDKKSSIVPNVGHLARPHRNDDCQFPIDDSWTHVHRFLGHRVEDVGVEQEVLRQRSYKLEPKWLRINIMVYYNTAM